jgi:AraC-like DNA-binding protein
VRPTIASGAIEKLLNTVRAEGVDPGPLCAEAALDPAICEDRDARVSLHTLHALWEAALRRIPRHDLALLGAQRYLPGDYGLVGFVCMNAATLGEGCAQLARFLRLWTDDPGVELRADGRLEVVYRTRFAERPGLRCATEASLAQLLHGARLVTQTALVPEEACFAHAGPPDTGAHEAFFGAPVRFSQPTTHLRLTAEQLAAPLPRADAQLGAFLRDLATAALAQEGAEEPLVDQLRRAISEALRTGVPTLAQLAADMATSERTLRRRLGEHGWSFRALLDATRMDLARSYVKDRSIPLAEVAFLLGFSEPSAFHRAFKRWTAMTPRAFRQKHGAAAAARAE